MKLITFKYSDPSGWSFSEIRFKRVNLFVGASGSGKTRMLNILFNIARSVLEKLNIGPGTWKMVLEHKGNKYRWECDLILPEPGNRDYARESIVRIQDNGDEEVLVDRRKDKFLFKGAPLPKLAKNKSAITLLKDEDSIRPLYDAFTRIMRRNFFSDELERAAAYQALHPSLIEEISSKKTLETLYGKELSLSIRFYILREYFKPQYRALCASIQEIFPFIEQIEFTDVHKFQPNLHLGGKVPVLAVKERKVKKLVPFGEMSSGMQKVFLVLLDIVTLPGENLYMIDEYENSLGVNAINFLPPFVSEMDETNQFILTSHHPYLINHVPMSNWQVFNRKGMVVTIRSGDELSAKYGKSKQKAFIQLLNDPFYMSRD